MDLQGSFVPGTKKNKKKQKKTKKKKKIIIIIIIIIIINCWNRLRVDSTYQQNCIN